MSGAGRVARWAAGALAGLSARDLAGALVLALIVVLALCWVLRDDKRSQRLADILGAWRGSRPAPAPAGTPARQRKGKAAAAAPKPPALPGGGALAQSDTAGYHPFRRGSSAARPASRAGRPSRQLTFVRLRLPKARRATGKMEPPDSFAGCQASA